MGHRGMRFGIAPLAGIAKLIHESAMLRWMALSIALFAGQPGLAQIDNRPPPPPVIRDPVPGPFFVYFQGDSTELDPPSLAFLASIKGAWNDGDGALVACTLSSFYDPQDPRRSAARWEQFKRLKAELNALGLHRLFWTPGDCPGPGQDLPEGYTGFALYGAAAL
jgi:hypothetical protein